MLEARISRVFQNFVDRFKLIPDLVYYENGEVVAMRIVGRVGRKKAIIKLETRERGDKKHIVCIAQVEHY
jgi:hypothetical protein